VKQKVRESKRMSVPRYDVKNCYHSEGPIQSLAKDHRFENVTLAVISLNAIWIAIDTDWNDAIHCSTQSPCS